MITCEDPDPYSNLNDFPYNSGLCLAKKLAKFLSLKEKWGSGIPHNLCNSACRHHHHPSSPWGFNPCLIACQQTYENRVRLRDSIQLDSANFSIIVNVACQTLLWFPRSTPNQQILSPRAAYLYKSWGNCSNEVMWEQLKCWAPHPLVSRKRSLPRINNQPLE